MQRTLYVEAGGQPGHRAAWTDPHANELSSGYFGDTLPGLDAGYLRPRYDGALLVQNDGGTMVWESLRSAAIRPTCSTASMRCSPLACGP